MSWLTELCSLLFPDVLTREAEQLLRHEGVRRAINDIASGGATHQSVEVDGRVWTVGLLSEL